MSSPARTKTKSKKINRRASRSRQRVQHVVQLERVEVAYADPLDFTRSQVPNILFERRDLNSLSSQATQLFHSDIVFEEDAERSWLLENMHSTTISIKVDHLLFSINANYAVTENQPTVLFLHGFGAGASWANWIKLGYQLSRYSTIFVDLPGFGQSSGRSLDQASWKRYGPEILIAILSSFHLHHSVHVVAQCGGAATTVRTINRYPQWFRSRSLVFCNSVIGDFGESKAGDFEANLTKFNIHIVVYWIPDKDHTQHCVAYKRWNKLRLANFRYLQLVDLNPSTQTMKLCYPLVSISKMSRCTLKNKAVVYKLSGEFVQQIIDILDRR